MACTGSFDRQHGEEVLDGTSLHIEEGPGGGSEVAGQGRKVPLTIQPFSRQLAKFREEDCRQQHATFHVLPNFGEIKGAKAVFVAISLRDSGVADHAGIEIIRMSRFR